MRRAMILVAVLCYEALGATGEARSENTEARAQSVAAVDRQATVVSLRSPVVDSADAITIPQMLSYQGRLADTLGVPVADTVYALRFRLHAQPSGGTHFWEENQNVRTTDGLFSVLLGSVTPIGSVPDAGALYLGMAVEGGTELTPRLRIASAAYSYMAERTANADLLQGRDTTTFSRSTHNHDAAYVNEGQADAVTGAMLVNGTVLTADVGDTAVTMAKLARAGATTGQVVKWTGSAWAPGPDNTGGGSGVTNVYQDTGIVCVPNPITSSGNVKLDLSYSDGRYVNEAQSNSVTSPMITDGNVTAVDIRDTTVNTAELKDAAVTMSKLNQAGATSGQVIKWTGSAWAPRNDSVGSGGGGTVTSVSQATGAVCTPNPITTTGTVGFDQTYGDGRYVNESQTASGDLVGTYPSPAVASNAITSAKVLDGSLHGADLAKPCTLSASLSDSTPVLSVRNDGTGSGIEVERAGNAGLRVKLASYDGLLVDSTPNFGVRITRAGSGVSIGSTTFQAVYASQVSAASTVFAAGQGGYNGFGINYAGHDGYVVGRTARHGFAVYDSAQFDGVYIREADTNGMEVDKAGYNGLQVDTAGSNGVYVGRAGDDAFEAGSVNYGLYAPIATYYGAWANGGTAGGNFGATVATGVGVLARAYNNNSSDTAIQAYGRGYATGGWYTGGFKGGREAPCVVSPERCVVAGGHARLVDGAATVRLDPIVSENIRSDLPVRVTVTPRGMPGGLTYVPTSDQYGFTVGFEAIPGLPSNKNCEFDWIAFAVLREPTTSAAARADWERGQTEIRRKAYPVSRGAKDDTRTESAVGQVK